MYNLWYLLRVTNSWKSREIWRESHESVLCDVELFYVDFWWKKNKTYPILSTFSQMLLTYSSGYINFLPLPNTNWISQ